MLNSGHINCAVFFLNLLKLCVLLISVYNIKSIYPRPCKSYHLVSIALYYTALLHERSLNLQYYANVKSYINFLLSGNTATLVKPKKNSAREDFLPTFANLTAANGAVNVRSWFVCAASIFISKSDVWFENDVMCVPSLDHAHIQF